MPSPPPAGSPAPERPPPRTLAVLGRLAKRYRIGWQSAAGALALLAAWTALDLTGPWIVGQAVDTAEALAAGRAPAGWFGGVGSWIVCLAAISVVKLGLQYAADVAVIRVGQDQENRLRAELLDHVCHLRFVYHDENRAGATIARTLRDMEKARHFFREVAFGYLELGCLAIGGVVMSYLVAPVYGAVVAGAVFGAGGLVGLTARRLAVLDRRVSDQYDEVSTAVQENVAGARVVRAFGREPDEVVRFGGRLGAFTGLWRSVQRFWTAVLPVANNTYLLAIPIVLVVCAARLRDGTGGLAEATTVLLYVRTVAHRMRPLTRLVILGQDAVASAARVFEVLDRREVIPVPATPRVLPAPPAGGGAVRFDDVHFGYPGHRPVLRGVTLDVPAGTSLGLIGPTGAGKSTLVHLIPRFYDPDRGRVTLDGCDVRELHIDALRDAVGLVFQEAFLFSATVAENIAYGRPDAARAEIERAARQAAAHEFIATLPAGYDTLVGERGVSLSGGQRQRIAIARALLREPRLLVFDDATAAVDAVTERDLFAGIRAAARGRTTIVISQRVTSVRWCDRIAVLEDGVIGACGTHAELLEGNALYAEILRHQRLVVGATA